MRSVLGLEGGTTPSQGFLQKEDQLSDPFIIFFCSWLNKTVYFWLKQIVSFKWNDVVFTTLIN